MAGAPCVQTLLVGLCIGLQLWARRLQKRLGHPRDGGWLLPWLADARRARALRWSTNLRPRRAPSRLADLPPGRKVRRSSGFARAGPLLLLPRAPSQQQAFSVTVCCAEPEFQPRERSSSTHVHSCNAFQPQGIR